MTTLDHDTDFQEDDEEDFLGDDDAPYLIEGDIALPEVTWCTNRLQICKGCNINIIILVQDLDPRSRLAIDCIRHPAKKWPNNTVPYRMSKNYSEKKYIAFELTEQNLI